MPVSANPAVLVEPHASDAAPLPSIQPGGGLCFGIELAWGRARRGLLRRLRPVYVRNMAARRRGACAGVPARHP